MKYIIFVYFFLKNHVILFKILYIIFLWLNWRFKIVLN